MTSDRLVRFNKNCNQGLSDPGRTELVCHELGHAVGRLDDSREHSDNSCMRTGAINSPFEQGTDGHDENKMQEMYAHNDGN